MKIPTFLDYFQGYSNAKIIKKNGKGHKIVRIYTDNYHVHNITDRQWVYQKLLYTGLILVSVLLYLFTALSRTSGNSAVFVAAFSGLTAFSYIFALVSYITYIFSPRKMTVFLWKKGSSGLKRWCFVSAWSLFCVAAASFIHMLFFSEANFLLELLCSLGYGLSGFFTYVIYKIESKTEYYQEHNDTQIPFYPESNF